jgi:hypothetical protein
MRKDIDRVFLRPHIMDRNCLIKSFYRVSTIHLKGQSHEKVCEIMTLDGRIGQSYGSPTAFKILKSAIK